MCHQLLRDARFHRQLLVIDEDLAARASASGCSECGGVLHVANYPRKARGRPEVSDGESNCRYSFCCATRDCRKRRTPTSVRFLDRRVYVSVVVVLAAVLAQGLSPSRTRVLCRELGVDRRTLARWLEWWQEEVPWTDYWAEFRGRLDQPLDPSCLPASLLGRIEAEDDQERLLLLLHLIEPLSHSALMRGRFARVA